MSKTPNEDELKNYEINEIKSDEYPGKRYYSGLCNANNSVYIYGGLTFLLKSRIYLNDFWILSLNANNNLKWRQINDIVNTPPAMYGHTLNYYNYNLYLIGGNEMGDNNSNNSGSNNRGRGNRNPYRGSLFSGGRGRGRNTSAISANNNNTVNSKWPILWIYSINDNLWRSVSLRSKNNEVSNVWLHSSVVYKEYVIVFGGAKKQRVYSNDIYIYNINNNEWNCIECQNKPGKRYRHSMCLINNNMLLIHGGRNERGLDDSWYISVSDIINNGNPCWIRINNNIGSLSDHLILSNNMNKIYCFGGNNNGIYNNNLLTGNCCDTELLINNFSPNYLKLKIPKVIINEIKKYCGGIIMHIEKTLINEINKRSRHNGCLININNIQYILIFAGIDGINKTNRYRFSISSCFNDSYLIDIKEN